VIVATGAVLVPMRAQAQSLPAGWTLRTIGSGVLGGRAAYGSGTFTVEGAGADIWGSTDQFSFVYRQMSGDVTVVARVPSLENTNAWAKGGLMIRESLSGGSKHAFALVSASRGLALQWRPSTGGASVHTGGGDGRAPVWLRLERRSSSFTAYRSTDGATWTRIGGATISMASTVYVGLAVTSHAPSTRATAQFSSVAVSRPLPAGWTAADIGSPSIRGSASYSGGVFTVHSAGSHIFNTSDRFTFTYRQVSGDVDILARVSSLEYVDEWSKAGVMVRASLRRDAAHASMFATPAKGIVFHRRPVTGFDTLGTSAGSGRAPVWLKLERRGSAVTAFRSSDGASWRMIGSDTVALPSTFYVGLAVASYDSTETATATFTNVIVRAAGSSSRNTPPTVSLTSPASGALFGIGASIALGATAADADGSIARVEFYRGTTRIATDTTAPYTAVWPNVAAGSYSLTALAYDDDGASTRSAARTVTVGNSGGSSLLTTAVFNPSPDHSTSRVTYYRLEVFTQGTTPSSTNAIASQNLGKPSVVNGECRVSIATLISNLPSGYYFSSVRAVGPSGSSARALSPVFRR
jgi:regulation of enolase protein 1 (concanavalin A-like superfamily)